MIGFLFVCSVASATFHWPSAERGSLDEGALGKTGLMVERSRRNRLVAWRVRLRHLVLQAAFFCGAKSAAVGRDALCAWRSKRKLGGEYKGRAEQPESQKRGLAVSA